MCMAELEEPAAARARIYDFAAEGAVEQHNPMAEKDSPLSGDEEDVRRASQGAAVGVALQLGVGAPGGCEIASHTLRAHEQHCLQTAAGISRLAGKFV